MTKYAVAVCAAAFLVSANAAPSFDCAKASGPIEQTICKSAELSAADKKLADTYNGLLGRASDAGKTILRDGQRQWLAYTRTICAKPAHEETIETCLTGLYDARQKQLDGSLATSGGISFVRTVVYKTHKEKQPEGKPEFWWQPYSTLDIAYPQIVAPKADDAFNKAIAQSALAAAKEFKSGSTDFSVAYDGVTVTDRLISVDTSFYFMGHGAAHPNHGSAMFHWMRAEGRPMKAEDLFAANTAWAKFVINACFAKVKKEGFVDTPADLKDIPKNPERWVFTKQGLTVRFDPYEVASYAEGDQTATIPWSALKPYLVKNPPVKF